MHATAGQRHRQTDSSTTTPQQERYLKRQQAREKARGRDGKRTHGQQTGPPPRPALSKTFTAGQAKPTFTTPGKRNTFGRQRSDTSINGRSRARRRSRSKSRSRSRSKARSGAGSEAGRQRKGSNASASSRSQLGVGAGLAFSPGKSSIKRSLLDLRRRNSAGWYRKDKKVRSEKKRMVKKRRKKEGEIGEWGDENIIFCLLHNLFHLHSLSSTKILQNQNNIWLCWFIGIIVKT